jgi:hypothetical protein
MERVVGNSFQAGSQQGSNVHPQIIGDTLPRRPGPEFQLRPARPSAPSSFVQEPQLATPSHGRSRMSVILPSLLGRDEEFLTPVDDDADELAGPSHGNAVQAKRVVQPATKSSPMPAKRVRISETSAKKTNQDMKKRGRPKGSRNFVPDGTIMKNPRPTRIPQPINAAAQNSGIAQRRRGRQPKPPPKPPREIYLALKPRFVRFLCEWKGCPAELHNLETLRRHIRIVHGGREHPTCSWANCGKQSSPVQFATYEDLVSHIEKVHMAPFLWHVGEGPSNAFPPRPAPKPDELPDYLFDEHGNQVTPSIRHQKEEDYLTYRENRRKLKKLLISMNDNLPDEGGEDSKLIEE